MKQDELSGAWCIAIRPGEGKSLKTASSRRRVPLHSDLEALGFLADKDNVRADGRLFPKLKPHKDGFGMPRAKTGASIFKTWPASKPQPNPRWLPPRSQDSLP